MLELLNVTLACVSSNEIKNSQKAIEICLKFCNFGDIVFITDKIDNNNGHMSYNNFIINELYKYIKTDYVLIIHWDGFILNPKAWTDEFLNYDYIGAPNEFTNPDTVQNGGFSLRSKKLMLAMADLYLTPKESWPCDVAICRTHRKYLTDLGFKIAPLELADKFSVEAFHTRPEKGYEGQFGFHNFGTIGVNEAIKKIS